MKRIIQYSIFSLLSVAFLASCVEEEKKDPTPETIVGDKEEGAVGQVVKYRGQIFSIPSPVQTALLIRASGVEYDESLLNGLDSQGSYINQFQKAMNMGVYGADLAYLSNYNNVSLNLSYFSAIEGMADELGIKTNIDPGILMRFNESIDNPDSLYSLNAELYRAVNEYLNDNERNETAALILAGGWIEALHISMNAAGENPEIRTRVAEQKSAIESLTKLLSGYDDAQTTSVREGFAVLVDIYEKMERSYTYAKPITDPNEKTTYLMSKTEVNVSDEQLKAIKTQVAVIRNTIIS